MNEREGQGFQGRRLLAGGGVAVLLAVALWLLKSGGQADSGGAKPVDPGAVAVGPKPTDHRPDPAVNPATTGGTPGGLPIPRPVAKAQPPKDLPPIEELLSKMPDGSPVKPIEIPDTRPVVDTEEGRVLADVERRADSDPEAAAAWVESMKPGELREESVAFVVERWSRTDPAKAAAWQQRMEAAAREN